MVWQVYHQALRASNALVLNALRHQWFGSDSAANRVPLLPTVLNALRHQWFGRLSPEDLAKGGYIVLNALRHQWFGRTPWAFSTPFFYRCSTPCGISGLARRMREGSTIMMSSAQRLAAISGLAGWAGAVRMVLPSGAQRLAASVVWQGSKCFLRSAKPMSAQRLAASVVWQDILRRITPRIPPLCSTPCGISGLAGTRPANSVGLPERCSTPCGISGLAGGLMISATSSLRSAQRLAAISGLAGEAAAAAEMPSPFVLNALRHQWFWQAVAKSPCRTRVLSAQRLAASVVWQAGIPPIPSSVTNACAQRLAASVVWQERSIPCHWA